MARFGRGVPPGGRTYRGSVAPGLLLGTLTDDYNDNVIDTAKWPGNFGTTSEAGGRARVECGTGFSAYLSDKIYGLPGSLALVRVHSPAASTATTAYGELYIASDQQPAGTALSFKADAATGLLTASLLVGGVDGGAVTVAYTPSNPIWLRIRETAGVLDFDYSLTGISYEWTNLRSVATPNWVTTSAVGAYLQGHRDAGVTDNVEFDNFNLAPADPIPAPRQPFYIRGKRRRPLPPGGFFSRTPDVRLPPSFDVGAGLDGALPLPFSVRITSNSGSIMLVDEIRACQWRSVAPGGFASATVSIARSLSLEPEEIKLYARMYIYDTRDGDTLWEGRVEDPGRSAGSDGETFNVTAIGPAGHARDAFFSYLPIDTSLNHFVKFGGSKGNTTISVTNDASDRNGVKVAAPGGVPIGSPAYVSARSLRIYGAGETLGSVRATAYSSDTSPSWDMRMYVYTGAGSPELIDSNTITTSDTSYFGEVGTDFTAGANILHLRMDKTTATSTPTDEVSVFWRDIVIRSVMADEEGTPLTDYSPTYITGSQIVQDLIGRFTTFYDGLDAYIEETFTQITQFAYPDGITVYDGLNDVIALEGAYYWAAWETVPRSGLWRFEFRSWPTHVRYEAGIDDGWDSPGSATDLYNRVIVSWVDEAGNDQVTYRTSTVPKLDEEGLTRTYRIELGTELGTQQAAEDAGDNFLAEHQYPAKNGRLTVARTILDYDRGMMTDPWKIRPGALIRLRGVDPEPSALNPDGRDGSTVFRIVAVSCRDDGTAELELDTDAYSTSQAIAALQTKRQRK